MSAVGLSAVSETLFLPLYARAMETLSRNPVIVDQLSVEVTRSLDGLFADSGSTMLRALAERKLPRHLPVSMALRTRAFDRYVSAFTGRYPNAIIVNLGCGLDTRFSRLDNGTMDWYNVDLPPVIALRTGLLPPRAREHVIPSSVLDHGWMRQVDRADRPLLVYAEGLFMYLTEAGVEALLRALQRTFPDSELVAEVFSRAWVSRLRHPLIRRKFRRRLHMSEDALFTYGATDSRDFERLGPGFTFLDDWSYFDDREPKLGWVNLLGRLGSLRHLQWTVHYRIDKA